MEDKRLLVDSLNALEIAIGEDKLDKMLAFMEYVLEANESINLTSITDKRDFIIKHIVDSLIILDKSFIKEKIEVMDLGTGAGFPGIPLKIAFPEIRITLVDSVQKKLTFIANAVDRLGVDVTLLHERAENLGRDMEFRGKYDIVLSRAVANMRVLSELCLPLTKVGGFAITSKGPKYKEELEEAKNAIETLGGNLKSVFNKILPFDCLERNIIVIEKRVNTPKAYPRKAGMPNKNPL